MAKTLTASQVEKLETHGVFRVDHNLYVQVRPNGAKSWLCRYMFNGKSRSMGLGAVRVVPLTKARSKANQAKAMAHDGIDPLATKWEEKRGTAPMPAIATFKTHAERFIRAREHAETWSNKKHTYQWSQSLETYAYPTIGHLPYTAITVDHMEKVLRPIWVTKHETAARVRGRIEKILGAAGIPQGMNPAVLRGPLEARLPRLSKEQRKVKHYDAVPYGEVAKLFDQVGRREGNGAAALRFVILTAARSGEVRGATWAEIDIPNRTWTIPAGRMKMREPHRVPLSDEAIAALPPQGKPDALLYPGANGSSPLSDMSLIAVMRKVRGEGSTVHGLRSTFRDWCAEQTSYAREVAESALAHQVGSAVERSYLRTDYFDKRVDLMRDWGRHVGGGAVG